MTTTFFDSSSPRVVRGGYLSKVGSAARVLIAAVVAVKVPAETAARANAIRRASEVSAPQNRIDDGSSPLVGQGAWANLDVRAKHL